MDTIAALATARGPGAVALVRVSGPASFPILGALCPELVALPEPRRAVLTRVVEPGTGELLDQAVVVLFPGPSSYTGEDVVELSCHGGLLSPRLVLEACLAAGAREAEPGEFTRRAYLNGKMDLVQAEAVLDLVEGRSRRLHRTALHHLERGLSERIGALRERVVALEALLVHHIDFPEEDEPPVPVERIAVEAERLAGSLETLLRTAPEGELLREGALAVLAGRTNSGKSSLFNALLGRDRAIVTEVPGTTRDALEALVSVGGFPFRLVDTAGLRETGEPVERLGIEVARRYVADADVILFCREGGSRPDEAETGFLESLGPHVPVLLLRTKADLDGDMPSGDPAGAWTVPQASSPEGAAATRLPADGAGPTTPVAGGADGSAAQRSEGRFSAAIRVSARTGEGLDTVKEVLPGLVFSGLVQIRDEAPVLTRGRQIGNARQALAEVQDFAKSLRDSVPPEVAATHLLSARSALEELLGVISPEEVLDRVFRDFCIGK